jgi:hypothetical protein
MPNRNIHVPVGVLAGVAAGLAVHKSWEGPYWPELIGALIGGALGGRLPDIIDPPDSPRHRGLGHSVAAGTAGGGLLSGSMLALKKTIVTLDCHANRYRLNGYTLPSELASKLLWYRLLYGFCFGLSAGWLSHLVLDGCTPDGLRLINGKL